MEKANEALAIKTLLVTNELFRSEMKNNDILVQFERCIISIQLIFILKEHVFPFCFVVEKCKRNFPECGDSFNMLLGKEVV